MHASAAESLLPFLHPNARVLDIGSGSGYLTAVLAEVLNTNSQSTDSRNPTNPEVTAGGKVVGLEHIQALRDLGENNMGKSERGREMLRSGKVKFVVGDGRKGWLGDGGKEEGWDAIHVGAAAAAIHPELLEQLRSPGR
jgi:protein-L-isoaspartate(D-aspartate) O-methyltransferase